MKKALSLSEVDVMADAPESGSNIRAYRGRGVGTGDMTEAGGGVLGRSVVPVRHWQPTNREMGTHPLPHQLSTPELLLSWTNSRRSDDTKGRGAVRSRLQGVWGRQSSEEQDMGWRG